MSVRPRAGHAKQHDMARKAFLIGCNSAGLKHCETDAARMKQALALHGYEIALMERTEHKAPYWNLLGQLQSFLNDCAQEDTLVFYFAAHSLSEGQAYKLVLADDINSPNNQLDVEILLPPLRESRPRDKLLIFDCCRAGKTASHYDWQTAAGEWCRIFTATSSKETALETDGDTAAGLFTAWICQSLTTEATRLVDPDGFLRINRIDDHIQQKAKSHHSPSGRPAPMPRLYGSSDKKIVLTEKITAQSSPPTGYPPALIAELATLLAMHGPFAAQVQACFDYCHSYSDPPFARPGCGTDNLNCVLDYLSLLYYQAGNRVPLPLVSFIARLSDALDNPKDLLGWSERLNEWLRKEAAVSRDHIAATSRVLGPTLQQQPSYLMVEIAPQRGSSDYHMSCVLQDQDGRQASLSPYDESIDLRAVPQRLNAALNDLTGPRPRVEFFLPKSLLSDDKMLDHWEKWAPEACDPDDEPRPLGVEYCLSLRVWERLRERERHRQCGYDHLQRYWALYRRCLNGHAVSPCMKWLKWMNGQYVKFLHKGALGFGLYFSPRPDYISRLLGAGVGIALWPRPATLDDALYKLLRRYLRGRFLHELPEELRKVRERLWASSDLEAQTGGVSLLWDDPNRMPGKADVSLDDIPLQFPT
jgi:hypothetical protein